MDAGSGTFCKRRYRDDEENADEAEQLDAQDLSPSAKKRA
jgi:hypothetical protein